MRQRKLRGMVGKVRISVRDPWNFGPKICRTRGKVERKKVTCVLMVNVYYWTCYDRIVVAINAKATKQATNDRLLVQEEINDLVVYANANLCFLNSG